MHVHQKLVRRGQKPKRVVAVADTIVAVHIFGIYQVSSTDVTDK